jgi:hypothetical protein
VRNNYNFVDKLDFLEALPLARHGAFKPQNIWSGFAATGIIPFDRDRVIQKLRIQLRTPTPPVNSNGSDLSSPIFQTPRNLRQLKRYATTVKDLVNNGHTSPSAFGFAFQQLVKSCESTMTQAAIIKKQFDDLFAANEKEKKKRQRSKKRLQHEGGITSEEAQELIRQRDTTVRTTESTAEASQPKKRAPPTCSDCHTVGHRQSQCPNHNPL